MARPDTGMKDDPRTSKEESGGPAKERAAKRAAGGERPSDPPPAGPHARPELTNRESTPGAGLLPDPDDPADAQDSASS